MTLLQRAARVAGPPALVLLLATAAWAGEASPAPPFLVSGTVIAPAKKMAMVVLLDERGKAKGEVTLKEGETFDGYRVARIQQDEVLFERDGRTFPLRVGNARSPASTIEIVTPYESKKERSATFVPPPANIGEIDAQSDAFIERLKANTEFQKGVEEVKRRLREQGQSPKPGP